MVKQKRIDVATYTIVKFKNLTPLHVGTGKENYDFSASELHSDTLSAAIAAIRAQQGKTDDVKEFLQSFVISSAFPFVGNSLFLPKPQGNLDVSVSDMDEYPSRKKLKKIRYIETSLWNQLAAGNNVVVKSNQLRKEFLLADNNEFTQPFKTQVNQRVTIPRDDNQTADPFFFEWKYFSPNAGLYCLLDASEEVKKVTVSLLGTLGEIGLGTDRNVGGGKFEVETSRITLNDLSQANAEMLLSLYIPTEYELSQLNLPNSRYDLVLRRGYMAGSEQDTFKHLRKKSIYMFNVGSVFASTQSIAGKVENLKPEWNDDKMHPVFRSGKPFVVPININQND